MIKFGMMGALGRMGRTIAALSTSLDEMECAVGFDNPAHPDFIDGNYESYFPDGKPIKISEVSPDALHNIDGVIDFSLPNAMDKYLGLFVEKKIPLVIGTTGFSEEQTSAIKKASLEIPVLMASNMSIGVNMLFALTELAAGTLVNLGFDTEMSEIHHRFKKDAPSGTAKTLEEIISKKAGLTNKDVVYGREGIIGERPDKELGSFALRGGDVVGDHTVFFLGNGERIELKHQAMSRDVFASGAINALKYIVGKPPGMYGMRDVLNLPVF
ncbi:MAG: 4-hydroxy-tetrahydrodipicolinate reductase [Leptospirales bacterium]